MEAAICPRVRVWMAAFGCAVVVLLLIATAAKAGIVTDGVPTDGGCPAIADKPGRRAPRRLPGRPAHHLLLRADHHQPRARTSSGSDRRTTAAAEALAPGARLHHSLRPRVHLRRRNGPPGRRPAPAPRRLGGQRQPRSSPSGRRRRSSSCPRGSAGGAIPATRWILNDMLHDLVAQPAQVYVVWRIDFVPSTLTRRRLDKAGAHQVAGRRREPEPLSGLRRAASGRPQRPLHVPRSGAGRGPPSVRRCGGGFVACGQPRLPRSRPELDAEPGRDADRHRRAPAPRRPRHAAAGHPRRPDQHALHLRRPLLRAGRRGLLGRRDGCDTAFLARAGEGGRHGERARDL